MSLTREQLSHWNENGFLLLQGAMPLAKVRELQEWTTQLETWPETPGKWMKYFESAPGGGRRLCRVENFIPYHDGLSGFLQNDSRLAEISELMGEKAILFKEKINFKLPGGKGFSPHQDAPAFVTFGQTYHITMMVAVDPSTVENGCLDVARACHKRGLFAQEGDGSLSPDVVRALKWEPVEMQPGDILYFDSYLPHGSASNASANPRRALYVTYNRESEGSRRDAYFEHKRKNFPPECERLPGVDYSAGAKIYNVANPID